ncbi:bacterial peptide chain release factor 1 (bRF-1) [Thermoanaerobacter thermohydrosulfuricus]|uniref:Peptide chain release factor 1 n=2 Tax=Thermoanaerobacter thermohydrosulfuricus TaxID=1516 RepID=M8CYH0_THETY|nr:peptide chain release factor 1 [Thermoanaerobacter thermohydrosulfuricus]EGD53038.1 peptide chain release factor 1 [Thermoanaerobacter ethanolicus JW 200]EMT39419.1 peptide chain release factor 1 [Thermoanaerobacter thermohydrosulfuricus WC1]SDF98724.1 bacterial peptide chain release factor 1 (bRF-1) [Thermoanaerobacter thermohydrosulfuricus]SFE67182.1 bacterial peptide chain release factor 1 (bRF-1) [Thermoanaerobacter thermohydrosulfuricus]
MIDKLQAIEDRYVELSQKISDPNIISNVNEWRKYVKEHAAIEDIVLKYREYKKVLEDIEATKELLSSNDEELKEMAEEELSQLEEKKEKLLEEIKILLIPKDPNDEKNVIMEIRAGAGGEEAALFAHDLFRMYSMYAEKKGWKVEIMSSNETDIGGFKEVILNISGKGAYSRLKYESGVHRVQRVPTTEAGGRIHTSTATVAVLPEVEEVDVEINPNDIKVDVFRSGGHGGQSVNTTDSAVRVTHIPTGIVVTCQDERSQIQNRERALKILRAKLYEMALQEQQREIAETRKSQVGTGERSERIRTYNFPQGRVTDHRIGLTLYRLQEVLDGDLDEIIDALILNDQAEKLKNMNLN